MNKIYLDTNIILEIILKTGNLFPDYKKIFYRITNNYLIVIPQVVVGETLIKILEHSNTSNKDKNVYEFTKILETNVDFYHNIPPLYEKVMTMAVDIKQNVDNIDYCDAVIVAHAINDGSDCALFTVDTNIHNSDYISDIILDLDKTKNIKINIIDSI